MQKFITANEAWPIFEKIPGIPKNVRRIVIDISVDGFVKVYYDTYADEEMLEVIEIIAQGAQIKHINEP